MARLLYLLGSLVCLLNLSLAAPTQANNKDSRELHHVPYSEYQRALHGVRAALQARTDATAASFPCVEWSAQAPCAQFDVIIIGGGPSGLQAAMTTGRFRRSVLILDSQDYRNAVTTAAHDLIGFDGLTPAAIRALARGNLTHYPTVYYQPGNVTAARSVGNGSVFEVSSTIGDFTARKIVLAMGVLDVLPDIEGIQDIWGSGGFWCPWCDGWEHKDGPLAVLDMENAGEALAMKKLNSDITIFTNGQDFRPLETVPSPTMGPNRTATLSANGVKIDATNITKVALIDPADRLSDVVITTSTSTYEVKGMLFTTVRPLHSADIVEELTVQTSPDNRRIVVGDYTGSTSAFGVWAVGDSASSAKNLANAIFSGKSAAVQIDVRLGYEDARSNAGLDWRY